MGKLLTTDLSRGYRSARGVGSYGQLRNRMANRASTFKGKRLVLLLRYGLTFPPVAGVLVPQTQNFLLLHIPISLVIAYGIDVQALIDPSTNGLAIPEPPEPCVRLGRMGRGGTRYRQ